MDLIQSTVFILILFHLTNVISGASLGNVEQFNETFDAEEQHRTVLQNIQKNYADESRNYDMADIENFLSGFMTPVRKEKTPIYTSKTFFGSDQFFGTRERSKDNSQQSWDPFRANRVMGSKQSYFDTPDDLIQQYANSKNNPENSNFKTGEDNAAEFPTGTNEVLENKDEFPFLDGIEDQVNDLSRPVDDKSDGRSPPVDDDAEDELDGLSQPVDDDAEDELDGLSQPVDDDAEDESGGRSQPVDDDAEDDLDGLSNTEDDDAEDDLDGLSITVDDDTEDELDGLSNTVDEDDWDGLSNTLDDDAEDDWDGLSNTVDDDGEDQQDEDSRSKHEDNNVLSHPIDNDSEDLEDKISLPVVGEELSERIDDTDKMNEFSHPVDDEMNELSQPIGENEDQENKFPLPLKDEENQEDELSRPIDKTQGHMDEFSETVDVKTEGRVNEFSQPIGDAAEDELDSHSQPLGELQGPINKPSQPIGETQGEVNEHIHSIGKTQSRVEDISTSEEGVFGIKDFHMDGVTTEKMFIRLSPSTMVGVDGEFVRLDESTENQGNLSILSLDGDASKSRKDELISDEEVVDSEFLPVDKLSPTEVTEDLRHLNMKNTKSPSENPINNSNILPLDEQNGNESHFGKISENLKSVSDSTEGPDLVKSDIDEFQGSGDMSDGFEALKDTSLELKSGRIIDVFPRMNNTAECTTPKGERGRCRSLTQCPLSELTNFNLFLQYVCLSRGVLVGVCCPDNPVVEISDGTENSTGSPVIELKQPIDGCGLNTNTRIVGGKVSFPHEWTWMVALLRRNRFFCGGVIINDWYILTAAHCVMGIKVSDLKVRLGEYNFNEKNEHQEDIPVAEIKRHALFVTLTFQHDIALLKLKRRIEYSKFIGSICLPDPKSGNFSNVNATVVGWGTVAFGGSASPVLRQVTVPVWDNDECDKTYRLERITNAFMCAGSPENGEDACQGDSGGPLMTLSEEGRWEVIGIVSWGRRCGDPTFPGVYTRVTSYLDWITENAN